MKYSRVPTGGGDIGGYRGAAADLSARDWSQQYEGLKKRIQNQRIANVEFTYSEKQQISKLIDTLASQLRIMGSNPLQYELVASEIARRETLIENLRKSTSNLFSSNAGSGFGGSGSQSAPSPYSSGQSQRQMDMIKLQDMMILEIGMGVDRLHGKALMIGDETKHHVRLLDDLDSNVDIATAALREEAAHAAEIKEKGKVCYMYICIAVEFVILLLLIIILVAH
ncbi:hypothetical protein B484DRAFT_447305 [Ochromonadaceae sp. CCMP2298]|nr:hypothetical protein B484DRAFT_447305 [Ochromonadaceae sp. CCMP2298]|mmetsp:Transcript_1003/g.2212  ORF Transcript_1003/g.2212 Transcript_1003/m.2212 type:complete len:225 (+) Transcript_1003:131-805(+)|eukprot:CAMPEP_0173188064 /NCGR_PEP_ID=MMETSP1141-20130122/11058_1 /TAXON_ID=483371 /ORGANISM="non described non described, Strain CCMP2298" /LENGTH=224 /DNA_ID=CAMNT_0014111973 /DNA_START=139 /DNA_END=813 /DNA_ORIENTATION=-